ncbi:MAG: heavy-metal-associated domain-containing protein [Georgenia sp.]
MSTTTYAVTGMTCGHCVNAVTEEVTKLTGVTGVQIELVEDGASRVTVTSEQELPLDEVRAAVDEAGYELAGASA